MQPQASPLPPLQVPSTPAGRGRQIGHGTHTVSIDAGNVVKDVGFYGLAKGNVRGGVPSARNAVYKVCDENGECSGEDILAGFDDAIADGVDIITASLGQGMAVRYLWDPIAIANWCISCHGKRYTYLDIGW
ncbi:hypothetical protein U1Q18_014951 [Sarracenia purpurea var. burkii]